MIDKDDRRVLDVNALEIGDTVRHVTSAEPAIVIGFGHSPGGERSGWVRVSPDFGEQESLPVECLELPSPEVTP